MSVLARQCLDHRIPNKKTLLEEVAAFQQERNQDYRPVNWRFTTEDARIKLKRLYPSISQYKVVKALAWRLLRELI